MAKNIDISSTVPVVDGSNFTNVSLYEQLGGVKSSLAEDILQLTQLLDDNEIAADSISYDEKMQAVIALGDVKVSLGSRDNMTDKIAELCAIMDSGGIKRAKGNASSGKLWRWKYKLLYIRQRIAKKQSKKGLAQKTSQKFKKNF